MDLFEHFQSRLRVEFWQNQTKLSTLNAIMRQYKAEIIKNWVAVDLIKKDDDFLIKWVKRYEPMTDEEYNQEFG